MGQALLHRDKAGSREGTTGSAGRVGGGLEGARQGGKDPEATSRWAAAALCTPFYGWKV